MDRGPWPTTVPGVTNGQTQVSNEYTHTHTQCTVINFFEKTDLVITLR